MTAPSLSARVRDCVVVGGGIAGCALAYELARRGQRVTLLERGALANAASGRNMGLLLNQVEPAAVAMARRSLEIYGEVAAAAAFQLRRVPQLLLAGDAGQLPAALARAEALRGLGMEAEALSLEELRRRLPELGAEVAGGVLVSAWMLEPRAATLAFAEAARAAGAEIRTGVTVAGLERGGVLTDAGRLAAGAVVAATGPWLGELVPGIPVAGGRGWCLRTGRLVPGLPWIVTEMSWPDPARLAAAARLPALGELAAGGHDRPLAGACSVAPRPQGDALVGNSLAASLGEAVEGAEMPRRLAERVVRVLPGVARTPVAAAWSAMRPMTPDGQPVCGRSAAGVWVHGGHASIGMMAAPATARWLAEAMLGGAPAPELAALNPGRFEPAAAPVEEG